MTRPELETGSHDLPVTPALQEFMAGVGDVFVEAGGIPQALDSYDAAVNPEPLRAAPAQ